METMDHINHTYLKIGKCCMKISNNTFIKNHVLKLKNTKKSTIEIMTCYIFFLGLTPQHVMPSLMTKHFYLHPCNLH